MKKVLYLIWLTATIAPFAYVAYFAALMASLTPSNMGGVDFDELYRLHMRVVYYTWLLLASYAIYIFRASDLPKDKKALLAGVLIIGNIVAMPVIWYVYVWKRGVSPEPNS